MDFLQRKCLLLNAAWLPIDTISVKKALEDMNASKNPKKAIKIEYMLNDRGEPDYSKPSEVIPLGWDEWITIAPRPYDENSVRTPNMELRVPTVMIVGSRYNKMPVKTFRATKRNLFERYKGIDYYSGEKLSFKEATLDHLHPRSKGGGNSWENLVITSGKINRQKGAKDVKDFINESGYKPAYKVSKPAPVTAQILINVLCPDWSIFLTKS